MVENIDGLHYYLIVWCNANPFSPVWILRIQDQYVHFSFGYFHSWVPPTCQTHVQNGTPVYPFYSVLLLNFILSSLNGLIILVKNQLIIDILGYFWVVNFIPLIYRSILMLVSYYLHYCCFVASFEIGKSYNFVTLFQHILATPGPRNFHMNFRISLSIFMKKSMVFW